MLSTFPDPRSLPSLVVLLLGLLLAFGASPAGAQVEVRPGLRAGATSMTSSMVEGRGRVAGRHTGLAIGGFVTVDVPGPFAVQPELGVVQKGAQVGTLGPADGVWVQTRTLNYFEGVVLGKVQLPPWGTPSFFAGPAIGINTHTSLGEAPNPGTVEYSLVFGGDARLGLGDRVIEAVVLDVRYAYGVTTYQDVWLTQVGVAEGRFRNRGVVVSAGVTF